MLESNININVNGLPVLAGALKIADSVRRKKNEGEISGDISNNINKNRVLEKFIDAHSEVFENKKLFLKENGELRRFNVLDDLLDLSPLGATEQLTTSLKSRASVIYDLTDDETNLLGPFCDDFLKLAQEPEIRKIITATTGYKNTIETLWRKYEKTIMWHVYDVLGIVPETSAKVNAYIMYPNSDFHAYHYNGENKHSVFFAKKGESDPYKILSSLTHHAVHQPILPYKSHMTGEKKDLFHCFIKFLTDKDVYSKLSRKSYLDIRTKDENSKIMGNIYPFWLGYRYRNAAKKGLNPVDEVRNAIERDKSYYDKLPINSKLREEYASYEFEKLDPEKIAVLFKEKRGITPYQFAKTDFSRTDLVYQERFVQSKRKSSATGEER